LHRCLQRHGISRLPEVKGDKPVRQKFKSYPIGYFHIDIAEVQTAEGKLYLFVAIDRTSKFAYAELHEKAGKMVAAQFLRNLMAATPYTIHTVLTDNGIQFTHRTCDRYAFEHIFDRVCREHGIKHRLTKVKHPWTNGQVERMNRTIKEATVKRFHYDDHNQLRQHLADFISAYNFGRRLKTLKGLTPYEFIGKCWTQEPERFTLDPIHQMPGLNAIPVPVPGGERASFTGVRAGRPQRISTRRASAHQRQRPALVVGGCERQQYSRHSWFSARRAQGEDRLGRR